jgi:hypothetical protein
MLAEGGAPGLSAPDRVFVAVAGLPGTTVVVGAGEGGRRGVEAQLSLVAGWLMAELVKSDTVPAILCSQSCTTVSIQL